MRLLKGKLEDDLYEWRNENYKSIGRSIGITEKDIVVDNEIKSVICLYFCDPNGVESDIIQNYIIATVCFLFGLTYISTYHMAYAGDIRRELYFTV